MRARPLVHTGEECGLLVQNCCDQRVFSAAASDPVEIDRDSGQPLCNLEPAQNCQSGDPVAEGVGVQEVEIDV